MTSQQLKCFFTVASCKNFSLAAKQLYLSQSSVSYHIKSLEKELGFRLFTRDTHSISLTPAGASYYTSMTDISARYGAALSAARQIAGTEEGKLKICFANPTTPTMMGQIVNRLYSMSDLPQIELIRRSYDDVLSPLLFGTADILFSYPHFFRKGLGLEKKNFCRVWTSCLVNPNHPLATKRSLTMEDLKEQTLLSPNCRNIRIEFGQIFSYLGNNPAGRPLVDSTPQTFEQVQGLAMAGRGIMLVRTMDCLYHENTDGLVSIPLMDVNAEYLIAIWNRENISPPARKLLSGF